MGELLAAAVAAEGGVLLELRVQRLRARVALALGHLRDWRDGSQPRRARAVSSAVADPAAARAARPRPASAGAAPVTRARSRPRRCRPPAARWA